MLEERNHNQNLSPSYFVFFHLFQNDFSLNTTKLCQVPKGYSTHNIFYDINLVCSSFLEICLLVNGFRRFMRVFPDGQVD